MTDVVTGDTVLFRKTSGRERFAAIVTNVNDDGTLSLRVIPPYGPTEEFHTVKQSEGDEHQVLTWTHRR